jgi:hypothetical protein
MRWYRAEVCGLWAPVNIWDIWRATNTTPTVWIYTPLGEWDPSLLFPAIRVGRERTGEGMADDCEDKIVKPLPPGDVVAWEAV